MLETGLIDSPPSVAPAPVLPPNLPVDGPPAMEESAPAPVTAVVPAPAAAVAMDLTLAELVADRLVGCDLHLVLPDGLRSLTLARRIGSGFGNLSEAIRQAVRQVESVDAQAPLIAAESEELRVQAEAQAEAVRVTLDQAQALSAGLARAKTDLHALGRAAAETTARAAQGRSAADALRAVMGEIEHRAARINEVIDLIDQIAFQTNVLSLNAAVEAARAGEAGRGFGVVAQEVRTLSQRAAQAAQSARELVSGTQASVASGRQTATDSFATLSELGSAVERAGTAMSAVADLVGEQQVAVGAIERSLERVAGLSRDNVERGVQIADHTEALREDADVLGDCIRLFRLPVDPLEEPRHAEVYELARATAASIAETFVRLVVERRLSPQAMFSTEYAPIEGTSPTKYHTPFDALCDEVLPSIQEPVLASRPWLAYAIAANVDGYVPTHNDRYCQPLTGDPKRDLVGNRTKRLFDDRVGRVAGSSTDDYRLQIYRRDTGQILFDLSVPIVLRGYHWGCFRVGYSLE